MAEDEAVEDLLTQLEQKLTEGDQNLCKQRPRTSANEACKNLRARKETAIYWTVRCEDHDLLKRFLRIPTLDANLGSHRDGDNDTELHWAARLGNVSVLSVLLEARCDSGYLEMRNKVKETALYDGIRAQSVEVVQILLEKGAKVMISNIASFSPLHLAAKRKKPAIAQLIWEHIVDKEDQQSSLTAFTDEGKTALHHAARDGHKDTVELLLKVGAEPNVISHSGKRPLHSAALRGNTKIMDLLWRAGAATNTTTNNGYTVLHCAAEQGHHEAIQIMLKTWTQSPAGNDSEPRPAEGEALSKDAVADAPAQGVNQGTPQSQKRVVSGGMPLTQEILACTLADGSTALHLAVSSSKKRGSSKVVGLFLDKLDEGIVAAQTKQGETILHLMARMRRDDLLDTLTKIPQIGKILEVQSNDGSTALHRAIEDGSSKLQERLINCMSDTAICFQNHDEETALHLAARKKRPYALKKLLLKMNPAAIAARNHYGETALHVAAAIGDVDVTRRLLDRMSPGDIALVDVKGQNAFTKAALTRNPESGIIELMVKHEADVPVEYETAWAPMDQQARMSVNRVLTEVLDNISWADYSSHTSWQMIVRWASRNGHIETVKRVLDAVPLNFVEEIDRQEHTKAERRGSTTVKGEQMPSAPKESALFWAALGGHDDIVNLLLKHPSLEAYYQRSERSLNRCLRAAQAAARNGHFSIVTVLIQHMQPRNGVDTQGWKPLDWAVAFGDPDIVRLMLIKGAGPLASSQRPTKSQEIDKILSSPQPTPRWYSRENPLSVWSSKPQLKLAPFEAACKRFNACVVDFYHHEGGMYPLEMNGRSIYDVIYNPDLGPNKIMEDARQSVEDHPAMHNPHSFRWIHLPANNWKWIQDLMKRICYQTKQEKECWSLQKFAEANRREHVGRPQSRFMFTDVRIENSRTGKIRSDKGGRSIPLHDVGVGSHEFEHLLGRRMAIYMPFITVETVQEQQHLQDACQEAIAEGLTSQNIHALENLQDIANAQKDAVPFLAEDTHGHLKELYNAISASNWSLGIGTTKVLERLAKAAKGAPTSDDGALAQTSSYDFSGLDLNEVIAEQKTISGPYHPDDSAHKVLLQYYLRAGEPDALHIRRTLDQYYYPALPDDRTKNRDGDQVVYRFQYRELRRAQKDTGIEKLRNLRICTVDQLWLWVLDEKTVITCFPQRRSQQGLEGNGTAKGLPDVLEFIRDRIHNEGNLELNSVYHLATFITSLCTSFVDKCTAEPSASSETFLQIFANAIGIESDDESNHFDEFKNGVKELEKGPLGEDDAEAQESSLDKSLRISKEVDCLNEVKDIRDELKMISSIFSHQTFVLGELRKEASRESSTPSRDGECPHSNFVSELPEYSDLETRSDQVRKMEDDAAAVYVRLNHLLDLKQKHANFLEAGLAREQAQQMTVQAIESGKEAKTILFLTFVTIVFAPMSFLTSLYALNVSAFSGGYVKGDESTYSSEWLFSRVFGISTAVAIPLILLALLVGGFLEKTVAGLKKWWVNLPINQTSETPNAAAQAPNTPDPTTRNPSPRAATPPSRSWNPPKPSFRGNVNGRALAPYSARRPTGLGIYNGPIEVQPPKQAQAQATSRNGSIAGKDSAKTSQTIVETPKAAEGAYNDIEGGNTRVKEGVFSRVFWRRNSRKSPTPPPGPT